MFEEIVNKIIIYFLFNYNLIKIYFNNILNKYNGDCTKLGIGDWGLGSIPI